MKQFIASVIVITICLVVATQEVRAFERPKRVEVLMKAVNGPKIDNVYAPTGLDINDVAQFVIEGTFPNACYRKDKAEWRLDEDGQRIVFRMFAFEYSGDCIQMETSFIEVVDVGILEDEGQYTIWHYSLPEHPLAVMPVHYTDSRKRDDELYAPVDTLFVTNMKPQEPGEPEVRLLTIHGTFPNSCIDFDMEKFKIARTGPNLIEILPIIRVDQHACCLPVMTDFTKSFAVPENIPNGKYLFHVRTLNGTSLNRIDHIGNLSPIHNPIDCQP